MQQYKFNPETLSYEKVNKPKWKKVFRVLRYMSATIVLAILYYIIYSMFFYTPKEHEMKREIDKLELVYEDLSQKYDDIELVFSDLLQRDSNIYRSIFEGEMPVDDDIFFDFKKTSSKNYNELIDENYNRVLSLLKNEQAFSVRLRFELASGKNYFEKLVNLPVIQPIKNDNLEHTAAGFGEKIHPIFHNRKFHEGIDFTASIGTDVFATANGKVTHISERGTQGKKIEISHQNGYKTVYAHLDQIQVHEGQSVMRGQVIATVGNTGISIAPHLHYEVRKDKKAYNPNQFLFGGLSPANFMKLNDLSNLGKTFD